MTVEDNSKLLTEVSTTLAAAGIYHDTLRLNARQHNITVTDDLYMFCKLTREGFEPASLALELRLAAHYGDTLMLRPRSPQLLPVGDTGQWMSVWAWERMSNLWSHNATPQECALAAELLLDLHTRPVVADLYIPRLENFGFLWDKMEQRLAFAAAHGITRADLNVLYNVYATTCETVRFENQSRMVLNHGDPHFGNLVRRGKSERLCYIDFESAQLSYAEFDFAALRTNLDIMGGNHGGWEAVQQILLDREVQLDKHLLDVFTVARLVSMTSYGLLHPEHYTELRERLRLLENYLTSGNLPNHFPRVV